MTTIHYRKGSEYVGGFGDGAIPPIGAVLCPAPTRGDDFWDGTNWIDKVFTQAEKDVEVTKTLDQHFGPDASEDTKVRNLMAADVLMGIDNTLTKSTALKQVRIEYEAHLRTVRGL